MRFRRRCGNCPATGHSLQKADTPKLVAEPPSRVKRLLRVSVDELPGFTRLQQFNHASDLAAMIDLAATLPVSGS